MRGDFRPTKEDVLKYIHENPDRSGKREIAKAFSLKGDDRVWLKDMLRDLQDEGLLNKERKRLTRAGTSVTDGVVVVRAVADRLAKHQRGVVAAGEQGIHVRYSDE